MYASRTTQLIVGIFALLGIGALLVLSLRLGKIDLLPEAGYTISANFDNISGLKVSDRVEIAGVQVGKVTDITLANDRARVAMRLHAGVKVDDEAIAAIKTSGIIGEKYVSIEPGAGEHELTDGATLRQTESSFILEDAIGQLINNAGSGSKDKDAGDLGDSGKSKK